MSDLQAQTLDVYINATAVGTLAEEARASVFTYVPDTAAQSLVSLLLPMRAESYKWTAGLLPFFQMNLPEGYRKDLIRGRLGAHADVSDLGLLTLTGSNGIGRVRVVPRGASFEAAKLNLDMASLLARTDSRENLLRALEEGRTEGVSGVMPKTLAKPDQRATTRADEFILNTGPLDFPSLAVNEYLCLEVARHAGLEVPETFLSDDGQVLAIRRFDLLDNGNRLGVEDFCARFDTDIPALPLAGKRVWASGRLRMQYGGARLNLSTRDMTAAIEQVGEAVHTARPKVAEYAQRYPEFREVAKRMLKAWAEGLEDIRPDARPAKSTLAPLRAQAGH